MKIPVRPQISHLLAILHRIGCRDNDDKSIRTSAAQAHVLQYIAALLFRQIDVQNNEGGTGHVGLGIGPIEEPYGLFAVLGDVEREREPGGPYRLFDQKHVRFIVIDNQYVRVRSGGRFFRRGG